MTEFILSLSILLAAAGSAAAVEPETENARHWQIREPPLAGRWEFQAPDNAGLQAEQQPDGTLTIDGDIGDAPAFWQSEPLPLSADRTYGLRFEARGNTGAGCLIGGTALVNRDRRQLGGEWQEYVNRFIVPTPAPEAARRLRFGGWRTGDRLAFRNPVLFESIPVFVSAGQPLTEEEFYENGVYHFEPSWNQESSACRLSGVAGRVAFNTTVWRFEPNGSLEYRFDNGPFTAAAVSVESSYAADGGTLILEAARNDEAFRPVGELSGTGAFSAPLPASLLPAEQLRLRLRGKQGVIQLSRLAFTARPAEPPADDAGRQCGKLEFSAADPAIRLPSPLFLNPETRQLPLQLPDGRTGPFRFEIVVLQEEELQRTELQLEADGPRLELPLPAPLSELDGVLIRSAELELQLVYRSKTSPGLRRGNATGGALLLARPDELAVWTAPSTQKVAVDSPLPSPRTECLQLTAAANETEAVQLLLTPVRPLARVKITADPLRNTAGRQLPAEALSIDRVEYVKITMPTDSSGMIGEWPDPLPPQPAGGSDLPAGRNAAFWVRAKIPAGTPAGFYHSRLHITGASLEPIVIPLQLEVYDFALPDRASCRTAFGLGIDRLLRYYRPVTDDERRGIARQYLQLLADNRISSYGGGFNRLDYRLKLSDDPQQCPRVQFDWTEFDANMTMLFDEFHANSAVVPVEGLGSGTFHARHPGSIGGITADDPRYEPVIASYLGQLDAHLVEKGWDRYCYTYTFDEPEEKDYPFVMEQMALLKKYAPHLRRLLTEQPEAPLYGGPNIWCLPTYYLDAERVAARRNAGDELWWYICTQPRAPFAGEFIDHPGTALRVWLWQTWQYRLTGILIWETVYWTSETAYPDSRQNPYRDPVAWMTGYGTTPGTRTSWGNGDGRLIYPPEPARNGELCEPGDRPVSSFRLEVLRDGLEDFEYLTMLQKLLAEKQAVLTPDEYRDYRQLLAVPESISRSLTEYTFRAAPIASRRDAIARAIVELRRR